MYLCICKAVSDQQIRQAVEQGDRTVGDVSARFGVGIECGKCIDAIREFLDVCLAVSPTTSVDTAVAPAMAVAPSPPVADDIPQRAAWFAIDL
ncbi:MAG TPA: (2Fe-2S)-binding protein [Candidatus Competibacter sp.]|nr:(2Fe-2S)-binding protein [Candidatus Competibacter sp.]